METIDFLFRLVVRDRCERENMVPTINISTILYINHDNEIYIYTFYTVYLLVLFIFKGIFTEIEMRKGKPKMHTYDR